MIHEINGDLLEAKTEAVVNAVNCVGVMGKGIALQFRRKFSEDYFRDYKAACRSGELKIGKVHFYALRSETNPHFIINFPTKNHWREKSRIENIENGLSGLSKEVKSRQISSISIPALGCGLGGLNWKDVRRLIETAFTPLSSVQIFLYPPV